MARKYKLYTAEFKLKAALEAAKNLKTINQIASELGVSPAQIVQWKGVLLKEGAQIFQNKSSKKAVEAHENISLLQQTVGKLAVELEALKKTVGISN